METKPNPETINPPITESDEARAVRILREKDTAPKAKKVPDPAPNSANLKIHTTKPLDQTLRKLKAKRVPHRYPKIAKGKENAESENNAGRSSNAGTGGGNDPGPGKSRWTILTVDWFRK